MHVCSSYVQSLMARLCYCFHSGSSILLAPDASLSGSKYQVHCQIQDTDVVHACKIHLFYVHYLTTSQ